MYVEKARIIIPKPIGMAASMRNEHDKFECYQGNKAVQNFGISVHGHGTWAKGHMAGNIETYDYTTLYDVYNLPSSESADYWFVKYRHETSHSELKKAFEQTKKITTHYSLDFMIEGNDYDINSVFITFEVIRLVINGETKDFVVNNAQSAEPKTSSGGDYPGGFKPV